MVRKEELIRCERCKKNKGVRYWGSIYVCDKCYYEIKYGDKK
jgi:ribosomal protein L37AE/L43A